jgi:hypothetical protein
MELTTRIYEMPTDQIAWHKGFRNIFIAFNNMCAGDDVAIYIDANQCSTQVHISPAKKDWTLDQLKAIAKAIIYFERCVDALMPKERVDKTYYCSNHISIFYQMLDDEDEDDG